MTQNIRFNPISPECPPSSCLGNKTTCHKDWPESLRSLQVTIVKILEIGIPDECKPAGEASIKCHSCDLQNSDIFSGNLHSTQDRNDKK